VGDLMLAVVVVAGGSDPEAGLELVGGQFGSEAAERVRAPEPSSPEQALRAQARPGPWPPVRAGPARPRAFRPSH
jgi:hypothetical protein